MLQKILTFNVFLDFCCSSVAICVWLFVTPWTVAHQAPLSFTISRSLLKFMSFESVMPFNLLILNHFLFLPAFSLSQHQNLSNESAVCIRLPKYWSFGFSLSPSNEYSGLISFRIDWLDLLAVQRILKSLLQHHSLKTSILQHSAFFMVKNVTSVHDYWKKYSFDRTLSAIWCLCFLICCLVLSLLFFQGASIF